MYPKDFSVHAIDSEPNTAFVIMPFRKEFETIYGEVCQTCIDLKIECKRADEIFSNRAIMETILDRIAKCEIIIADLTDKNPNVYYEVGIAHTLRDQDAVILITRDIQSSPFDINHRSILIYDERNLIKFKSDLKRRIIFSRSISSKKEFFKRFLLSNSVKRHEVEAFIDISDKLSQRKLEMIYDLINSNKRDYENDDVETLYDFFTHLEDYQDGLIRKSALLLKLEVFSSPLILSSFEEVVKHLLVRSSFNLIHLDDFDRFNFATELCFKMIESERLKSEAINWLIDYLSNYRMGRIDVIRSKVEAFFVRINDKEIDAAILQMLQSPSMTMRESAADICGQKGLGASIPFLTTLIKTEDNPHVVRSCITALTRLKGYESAEVIHNWMIHNQDKWGDKAVSGSLKKIALIALKELDQSKVHLASFEKLIESK